MQISSNPYKGLVPFSQEDENFFFGRGEEIDEISRLFELHKVIVIYGKSGVGKTSIIRAGLSPKLIKRDFSLFYIRVDFNSKDNPIQQIVNLIEYQSNITLNTSLSIVETLDSIAKINKNFKPVLIFDQFEEVFFTSNREWQQSLIQNIADIIYGQTATSPKFIFSIREDFLAALDELAKLIPIIRANVYRIKPYVRKCDLLKIITGSGNIDLTTAELLLSKVCNDETDFYVNSTNSEFAENYKSVNISLLQMILYNLYNKGILQDNMKTRNYLYYTENPISDILSEYVSSVLGAIEPDYIITLFNNLIRNKFRVPIEFNSLKAIVSESLINDLINSRILKIYYHNGIKFIELLHDFLIEPILNLESYYSSISNPQSNIFEEDRIIKQIMKQRGKYIYDIAITFAGEDRMITKEIAIKLKEKGVSVFFDEFERPKLFGKNLYDTLSKIYTEDSRFCLMMISKHYVEKKWTGLERECVQDRALQQSKEYILPVRIDDTIVPGLKSTISYFRIAEISTSELANIIVQKLISEE